MAGRRYTVDQIISKLREDEVELGEALKGDTINAVLAAARANLRELLRRFSYAPIRQLEWTIVSPSDRSVALKYVA